MRTTAAAAAQISPQTHPLPAVFEKLNFNQCDSMSSLEPLHGANILLSYFIASRKLKMLHPKERESTKIFSYNFSVIMTILEETATHANLPKESDAKIV